MRMPTATVIACACVLRGPTPTNQWPMGSLGEEFKLEISSHDCNVTYTSHAYAF